MLEGTALVIAGLAVGLSLYLLARVKRLEERLALPAGNQPTIEPQQSPLMAEPNSLAGRSVTLCIEQDHAHSLFTGLLKEHLLRQDVAECIVATRIGKELGSTDLTIVGKLTCHGYAEVYYDAELACHDRQGPVCTLIERPPSGDRPENLAMELVSRLSRELQKREQRGERQAALRELGT